MEVSECSPMKPLTGPGGVQWMCAGKGIIHAEMPVHAKGFPDPRGLQLWVDLPKQVRQSIYNCGRNPMY
jgi:redox-sensitive bicupin YhaK (pirin superfamily)